MKRTLLDSIDDWNGQGVLSVLGPTGSGKTSTVIDFLRKLPPQQAKDFLLVNVDSVAFYRGLDIGSAKVSGNDRSDFEWIGLDFLNPDEPSTARRFLDTVEPQIVEALQDKRPVLLVGGSGFYERALVEGVSPGEASDADFQKSLEPYSNEQLHARLLEQDAKWGEKIFPNDRYRVTRYLDLTERQGLSYAEIKETKLRNPQLEDLWNETFTLVLKANTDRKLFRDPLAQRIDEMIKAGWVEETKNLLEQYRSTDPGMQSIGYRDLCSWLETASPSTSNEPPESLKVQILQSHLHYVKKQQTWLRPLLRD